MLVGYDKKSPKSIEAYAQRLIGKTFRDIINQDTRSEAGEDKRNKGNLGQIIEENHFHYECNSLSEPDFSEAGVELKVSPYKINQNGEKIAKERLILTMIDYFTVVYERKLEESHLWYKCRVMLLIYYLYNEAIMERIDYTIHYAKLFTPPENDLKIIRQDFDIIVGKIRAGQAHELSEADTLYLGACTKGAKGTDRRSQPYSDVLAKPRAFSFKNSYMTFVLNHYIVGDIDTYEQILPCDTEKSFEQYVIDKIDSYKGYSLKALCKVFSIPEEAIKNNKGIIPTITYKILGIHSNKAEEFEKAGIVIKTIRIQDDGIRESMSFPAFKFKELIKEEWEDSTFGNYLRETKFLFVVFKYDSNSELILRGCQFWNMPYADIEIDVKSVWERTKSVLKNGLIIEKDKHGRLRNNLPKMTENRVCHVRPHARNANDTYELPDGRNYPKQCFWLSNKYIYSQIADRLK
jgi:DNA mismatch repair protein MutH